MSAKHRRKFSAAGQSRNICRRAFRFDEFRFSKMSPACCRFAFDETACSRFADGVRTDSQQVELLRRWHLFASAFLLPAAQDFLPALPSWKRQNAVWVPTS